MAFSAVVAREAMDQAEYICDGTDDQVQIQAAIDAAATAGGGMIYIADGTYNITGTITVKSRVTLLMDQGAVLDIRADVNGVYMQNTSQLRGGTISTANYSGFTKAAIYMHGDEHYHMWQTPTMISNIFLDGHANQEGYGLHYVADNPTVMGYSFGSRFEHMNILHFNVGINIQADDPTDNWFNGNSFRDIFIINSYTGIILANYPVINNFSNLFFQGNGANLLIDCRGRDNNFNPVYVSDFTDKTGFKFSTTAEQNQLVGRLNVRCGVEDANGSNYVNSWG